MGGFTKLWSSITDSSIWFEPNEVRLTWITMLAMADAKGFVSASILGLANRARVDLESCKEALSRLSSPDPHSRTKDNEGRRIEEVDGGWMILNYTKYREERSKEDRKTYMRRYMQEKRDKKRAESGL